jgi:Trk K+ transport system NAD-binding subunit
VIVPLFIEQNIKVVVFALKKFGTPTIVVVDRSTVQNEVLQADGVNFDLQFECRTRDLKIGLF